MAEPIEDSEHALNAFRERAYPRRARRRIAQSIVGTLAAAVIIGGATTAVVSSARKGPGFIGPGPKVPLCHVGDVQPVTVEGDHGKLGVSVYATKAACRVDETVEATVFSNKLPYVTTEPVHRLAVQGNGTKVRIVGVVPTEPENAMLTFYWTWRNWCGPDRSFSFSFKPTGGATDVFKDLSSGYVTIPSVPTCTDPSKPSVISADPPTLTPRVIASGSSGPAYETHPHVIAPRPGLTNLVLSPIDQVLVHRDDKTLIVSFTHGVGCRIFSRIDVTQDANGVTIAVYVGDVPGSQSACMGEMVSGDAAMITLEQPLGNRPIYDATHPGNLGVPVYHVKT